MKSMKKMLASLLMVTMIFSFGSAPAYAAADSEVSPQAAAFPDLGSYFCSICTNLGTIEDTWYEYDYYGGYIWNRLYCKPCDRTWYTRFQLNSMASVEHPVGAFPAEK